MTIPGGLTPLGTAYQGGNLIVEVENHPSDTADIIGLTDPLTAIWELTPYSFVVDWFIPIGDYLQNVAFAANIKINRVIRSRKNYIDCRGINPVAENYIITKGSSLYRYKYVVLSRTISNTLDVPLPRPKPLAEVPSFKRAANAVALLLTAIHR